MKHPIMPPGDPRWVAEAIGAVAAFQPDPGLGEPGLRSLLAAWSCYDRLTAGQVEQVVKHFVTAGATRRAPGAGDGVVVDLAEWCAARRPAARRAFDVDPEVAAALQRMAAVGVLAADVREVLGGAGAACAARGKLARIGAAFRAAARGAR